jgi:hypothetical protein
MIRNLLLGVALLSLMVACSQDQSATPPPKVSAHEVELPGAPVMVGAGDIAVCGTPGDEATGKIADSVLTAYDGHIESATFTLGDNAYPSGDGGVDNDLPRCFAPSWGTARVMNVIHPAPGNHDYDSGSSDPYFGYFGGSVGPWGKGYYSYNIGDWHVVSLNSELYFEHGSASEARQQEDWLRNDLNANRRLCTLAYFHRPLFSSGDYGSTHEMQPLWTILYDANADLILNGHEHHYERFLPQTPTGASDPARGITEIITGTGGAELRRVHSPLARNSAFQIQGHYGILKLTLGNGEYRHAFIDTDGTVWDADGGKCH